MLDSISGRSGDLLFDSSIPKVFEAALAKEPNAFGVMTAFIDWLQIV